MKVRSAPRASTWRRALFAYRAVIVVLIVEIVTTIWLRRATDARPNWGDAPEIGPIVWAWAALALFAVATMRILKTRPMGLPLKDSYAEAWRRLRAGWLTPEWVTTTALLGFIVPAAIIAEAAAQPAIPIAHAFAWDVRLDAIDRAMHGGRPAWEWLRPLLSRSWAVRELDVVYFGAWPIVMLAAGVVPIVAPESFLRRRFVLASVLTWYLGGVLAELLFSSGGPVYFGYIVHGPNPYAALMEYVAAADRLTPLTSFGLQQRMWISYTHRLDAFGIGAAAMPSLHVASVTVMTCAAFAIRSWLGIVSTVFTLLILLGSVALGWHYAIDGYLGAAIAILCWWAAGRLARMRP